MIKWKLRLKFRIYLWWKRQLCRFGFHIFGSDTGTMWDTYTKCLACGHPKFKLEDKTIILWTSTPDIRFVNQYLQNYWRFLHDGKKSSVQADKKWMPRGRILNSQDYIEVR